MDDGVEASKVRARDVPDIHPQPGPVTRSVSKGALSEEFAIQTNDVQVRGPEHGYQHRSDVTLVARYEDLHRSGLAPSVTRGQRPCGSRLQVCKRHAPGTGLGSPP